MADLSGSYVVASEQEKEIRLIGEKIEKLKELLKLKKQIKELDSYQTGYSVYPWPYNDRNWRTWDEDPHDSTSHLENIELDSNHLNGLFDYALPRLIGS